MVRLGSVGVAKATASSQAATATSWGATAEWCISPGLSTAPLAQVVRLKPRAWVGRRSCSGPPNTAPRPRKWCGFPCAVLYLGGARAWWEVVGGGAQPSGGGRAHPPRLSTAAKGGGPATSGGRRSLRRRRSLRCQCKLINVIHVAPNGCEECE